MHIGVILNRSVEAAICLLDFLLVWFKKRFCFDICMFPFWSEM